MNYSAKIGVFFIAMSVASLWASESFGGIGVSIYPDRDGVRIAEVIPGTPAAESKLQAGDVIVAVDGKSLKGMSIEESKAKLRGVNNKPLEIIFVSKGDTLSTVLRRVQITVKDLESKSLMSWYGGRSRINADEIETFAGTSENGKQLVAVLQNGKLVSSDMPVSVKSLNGIYVERTNEFVPKVRPQNTGNSSGAVLKGLTRTTVGFELKSAGRVVVSITDADGSVVSKIVNENACVGYNSLNWNSENVPSGRYMVSIEHDSSVSGKYVMLK